jgi:hypothetical protein
VPAIRQTNFRAGELSPLLWGRTDLPVFGAGLRTCRNFFPTKQGSLMSRPGTTYVGGAKGVDDPGLGERDGGQARLIRFDSGDELYESYALEVGFRYMRFIANGGIVESVPGTPYEIATPWSNTEIWELQYAQIGDVLVIVHPNHDPYELVRHGHTDWELRKFRFKAYEPFDTGRVGFTVVTPDNWAASTIYVLGAMVANGGKVYEAIATTGDQKSAGSGGPAGTGEVIVDNHVTWSFVGIVNQTDTSHLGREWQWRWTALVRDNETNALYETLSLPVTEEFDGSDYDDSAAPIIDFFAIYPDMPVRLRRPTTASLGSPPEGSDTYTIEEFLLYRGRGGLFGFIGSTKTTEFIDFGDAPNYAVQPPQGNEPFGDATEATGVPAPFDTRRLDRPSAVAFFQQRIVFGGLTRSPQDVFASKTGDFQNWDERKYLDYSGEPLHFQLAATRRQKMRSFARLGRFLLSQTSAEQWYIGGVQGSPLDFDSVDADVIEPIGSLTIGALLIEGAVLFARAKGFGVRALMPGGQNESPFSGVDVSVTAEHLFRGKNKGIVDWTHQEDPFGLTWVVREDGQLLSLTFTKDSIGWAHHDTDGVVESVCSIPEGTEDAVYLVVVRQVGDTYKRYIERMTSRVLYEGPALDDEGNVTPADDICIDCAKRYYGAPARHITGLDHLEGRDVWVIGPHLDPLGPFTVASGAIDMGDVVPANVTAELGVAALLVYVGLKFTCDLETLDIASSDARLRQKTVSFVGFEVDETRGIKGGIDFDHLDEFDRRDLDGGYDPIGNATALVYRPVPAEYNQSARLCLRQDLPLPITVIAVTREVDVGGSSGL